VAAGYQLLDVGGGARLERFGDRLTDRPYPAALGARGDPEAWAGADLRFDRDRGWTGAAAAREPWPVSIEGVTLELRPTDAGQVGLFPEHAAMLPWLVHEVARRLGDGDPRAPGTRPAVLHLFAYTGLATLATVAAGARLTHVDASRPAVGWARGNATRSGLDEAPVRWIVDDAVAFTGREIRRGRHYAGVILDPPSYGHGPGSGAWQLERDLSALLDACVEVLEPDGFVLLTAHTEGFDSDRLARDLAAATRRPAASMETGHLTLETPDGRVLRLGAFARSAGRAS
jgi:23S rRNA (cytosine1962-C5)-methyltransferase